MRKVQSELRVQYRLWLEEELRKEGLSINSKAALSFLEIAMNISISLAMAALMRFVHKFKVKRDTEENEHKYQLTAYAQEQELLKLKERDKKRDADLLLQKQLQAIDIVVQIVQNYTAIITYNLQIFNYPKKGLKAHFLTFFGMKKPESQGNLTPLENPFILTEESPHF